MSRPFRDAPIRESCLTCSEPAEVRCDRCGTPLCTIHAPAGGNRCIDCEAVYHARISRPMVMLLPLGIWMSLMLVAATYLGVVMQTRVHFNSWLALLLSTFFLAPFFVGAARSAYLLWARWRFLRERDDRCRLPLTHSIESWFDVGESW